MPGKNAKRVGHVYAALDDCFPKDATAVKKRIREIYDTDYAAREKLIDKALSQGKNKDRSPRDYMVRAFTFAYCMLARIEYDRFDKVLVEIEKKYANEVALKILFERLDYLFCHNCDLTVTSTLSLPSLDYAFTFATHDECKRALLGFVRLLNYLPKVILRIETNQDAMELLEFYFDKIGGKVLLKYKTMDRFLRTHPLELRYRGAQILDLPDTRVATTRGSTYPDEPYEAKCINNPKTGGFTFRMNGGSYNPAPIWFLKPYFEGYKGARLTSSGGLLHEISHLACSTVDLAYGIRCTTVKEKFRADNADTYRLVYEGVARDLKLYE